MTTESQSPGKQIKQSSKLLPLKQFNNYVSGEGGQSTQESQSDLFLKHGDQVL